MTTYRPDTRARPVPGNPAVPRSSGKSVSKQREIF
ncbi:hypothetical protein J2785_002783 [Burkholderia ambifaria]|nr:hypothetical protein [Burkholderia ambifaria]